MAAVTLAQLMDPLTKIQAATETTADAITGLVTAMATQGTVGDAVQSAILKELQLQTALLKKRNSGGGLSSLFGGSSGNKSGASKLEAGGNAFKALGAGTIEMAKGLLVFMLVPRKTINKFNEFVKDQLEIWGASDKEKLEEGTKAFALMGSSILTFAKDLAKATLFLIPAAVGIPLMYIATALIVPLFLLLGTADKRIRKGAKALDRMGDALKSFATGLAFFALTTLFILMVPQVIVGMVGVLLVVGGAVAVLGLASKQIRKGAAALALTGVALGVFGLGYAIFAFAVASTAPTLESVAIQAGILVGIGIATAIVGIFASTIVMGAVGLAAMGIGLLLFSIGYIPFEFATTNVTMEEIGVQAGVITAMGLVFAAAGAGAIFIIPGAIAMGAVGIALMLLAPGLMAIKKVDFDQEDSENLATLLAGIKMAFIGGQKEDAGFFSSLKGAFAGVMDSGAMIAAAAAYSAAGMALVFLSFGLKQIQKVFDNGWDLNSSKQLATVLGSISAAFAQAGGEPSDPGGLFGKVFGTAFSPNAVERGIDSVMDAGKALRRLATGLTSFQKLIDSNVEFGEPDASGNYKKGTLGYAIVNTVGFVQKAFAAVAEEGTVPAGGFFNTLFDIKKNKVQEGIDSVSGAGKQLTQIVKGLDAFQGLKNPAALANKVSKVLGIVGTAFASIGGNKVTKKTKALFGLIDVEWDKNNIKEGVKAVRGVSKSLEGIAKGLTAFSGKFDATAVATSIATMLTSVGDTFANLYKENPNISAELKDFSGFIVTLGDVAKKGLLDDAAEGIEKIAKAIDGIDTYKTELLGDLFKSASQLSRNDKAYIALGKAVERITKELTKNRASMADLIQNALPGGGTPEGGGGGTGNIQIGSAFGADAEEVVTTLRKLNATMNELPGRISDMKLVVRGT